MVGSLKINYLTWDKIVIKWFELKLIIKSSPRKQILFLINYVHLLFHLCGWQNLQGLAWKKKKRKNAFQKYINWTFCSDCLQVLQAFLCKLFTVKSDIFAWKQLGWGLRFISNNQKWSRLFSCILCGQKNGSQEKSLSLSRSCHFTEMPAYLLIHQSKPKSDFFIDSFDGRVFPFWL